MPRRDGLELVQSIHDLTQTPPIFIILSGYSDFDYAKQAIRLGVTDYLVKPINKGELVDTVSRYIEKADALESERRSRLAQSIHSRETQEAMRSSQLRLLLNPRSSDDVQHAQRMLARWNIDFHASRYLCLLGTSVSRAGEDDWQRFSMRNICGEVVAEQNCRALLFEGERSDVVILLPGEDLLSLRVLAKQLAVKLVGTLRAYLKTEIIWGLGDAEMFASGIAKSYACAVQAHQYRIFGTESSGVFPYYELPAGSPEQKTPPIDWRYVYRTLLKKGSEEALRPFDALLAEQPDLSLAQRIAREYAAMKRVLSEALLIEDDSPTCPDFFDIVSRLQLREVAHTFAEAVRTQYLSSDLDAPRCSIIFEIMQYIKENLASDVTLGSIAEHFAYHPNYVSTLFKRKTRLTPMAYREQL